MITQVLLLSTFPDRESAEQVARALVEDRLAACVNVGAQLRSFYYWEGKLESSTEVPIMLKTTRNRVAQAIKLIEQRHPYDLPEVITLDISGGSERYLNWIDHATTCD